MMQHLRKILCPRQKESGSREGFANPCISRIHHSCFRILLAWEQVLYKGLPTLLELKAFPAVKEVRLEPRFAKPAMALFLIGYRR